MKHRPPFRPTRKQVLTNFAAFAPLDREVKPPAKPKRSDAAKRELGQKVKP